MRPRTVIGLLAHLWASPTTALGLSVAFGTWLTGGEVRRRDGVLEVAGGLARSILESPHVSAAAMTLGHVILARDAVGMERHRHHEHGHVRQCELFGPLFVPAYLAAGLVALGRGGQRYADNWFERDAERYADRVRLVRADGPSDAPSHG